MKFYFILFPPSTIDLASGFFYSTFFLNVFTWSLGCDCCDESGQLRDKSFVDQRTLI